MRSIVARQVRERAWDAPWLGVGAVYRRGACGRGASGARRGEPPDATGRPAVRDSTGSGSRIPTSFAKPARARNARTLLGGARKVSPGMGTAKEKSDPATPPKAALAVRH